MGVCIVILFIADVTDADGNFTYIDPDHTLTCRYPVCELITICHVLKCQV